ncbi:MAG: hypothetical protein IJR13_05630, partial [Bacteroidales bacterium]|nr:hypothetical protein [Bacteroidales bacterium]
MSRNEFLSFGTNANIRPQVSPWLSYVYANDKFSINAYMDYSYSRSWNDQKGGMAMLTPQGDTTALKSYTSHGDNWQHGGYFYVGGHFNIDTQRTLAFWGGAYPISIRGESHTDMSWQELVYSPGDYSYRASSSWEVPQGGYYGGLDYTCRFGAGNRSRSCIRLSEQLRLYKRQPPLDASRHLTQLFEDIAQFQIPCLYHAAEAFRLPDSQSGTSAGREMELCNLRRLHACCHQRALGARRAVAAPHLPNPEYAQFH